MPQAPISNDVQVMQNFFRLQWMDCRRKKFCMITCTSLLNGAGAGRKDLARYGGPAGAVSTPKSSALCVRLRRSLCGVTDLCSKGSLTMRLIVKSFLRIAARQAACKSNTGLAPFSHNLEHQVERLLLFVSVGLASRISRRFINPNRLLYRHRVQVSGPRDQGLLGTSAHDC